MALLPMARPCGRRIFQAPAIKGFSRRQFHASSRLRSTETEDVEEINVETAQVPESPPPSAQPDSKKVLPVTGGKPIASRQYQLMRSFFYVPGSNAKFLDKCHSYDADLVVLDLEDGVAPGEKDKARQQIIEHLMELKKKLPENGELILQGPGGGAMPRYQHSVKIALRINALNTDEIEKDIKQVLYSPAATMISTVVLPKVERSTDVPRFMNWLKARTAHSDKRLLYTEWLSSRLKVIPLIESPLALSNLQYIFKHMRAMEGFQSFTGHENLAARKVPAAVFAAEDFRSAAGLPYVPGNPNLHWSRSQFVMTCKAFRVEPLDMVCLDFREEDQKMLKAECKEGFEMGFVGKQVIHPSQIKTVNEMFAPTQEQIEFAKRVISAREPSFKEGKGAVEVDGKMIDEPMWKYSTKLLNKALQANLISEDDPIFTTMMNIDLEASNQATPLGKFLSNVLQAQDTEKEKKSKEYLGQIVRGGTQKDKVDNATAEDVKEELNEAYAAETGKEEGETRTS